MWIPFSLTKAHQIPWSPLCCWWIRFFTTWVLFTEVWIIYLLIVLVGGISKNLTFIQLWLSSIRLKSRYLELLMSYLHSSLGFSTLSPTCAVIIMLYTNKDILRPLTLPLPNTRVTVIGEDFVLSWRQWKGKIPIVLDGGYCSVSPLNILQCFIQRSVHQGDWIPRIDH
jgi:hypothetical protein